MFRVLLWKETREHLMTFRFAAALVTTFVLVVISVWVLGDDYLRRRDLNNRLAESYAEDARDIVVPSQILPVVQRPPSALGIFAQGEDGHLGHAVQISRWRVPDRADNNLSGNVLLAAMPTFDLLSIVVVAISLFGVLLSFDAISAERERGTLKMLCAFPTARGGIFAAKFAAGIAVLSLPLLLSSISALLCLQIIHGISFSAAQWLAIGMMISLAMIYGAFFIALGLISSAFASRSSTSLALALLLWTVAVVLIPSLGQNLAPSLKSLLPPEQISRLAQESDVENRARMLEFKDSNDLELSSWGDSNIGGQSPVWYGGEPDWLTAHMRYIGFYEALYQDRADRIWEVTSRHLARKREQYDLGCLLAALSPAHHLRCAMTTLAGTDYASYAEFMDRTRRHRTALLEVFQQKGLFGRDLSSFFTRFTLSDLENQQRAEQMRDSMEERRRAGLPIWEPLPADYIPAFVFEGSTPRFAASLWPLAVLTLITTLAFAAGFAVFVKFDVR